MNDVVAQAQRKGVIQAIFEKFQHLETVARRFQQRQPEKIGDFVPLHDLINEIEALYKVAYPDNTGGKP